VALTGDAIERAIADGRIEFDPFARSALNPNSIDIHLGSRLTELTGSVVGPDAPARGREIELPKAGLVLAPGSFYLATSVERFGSAHFAPIVHGKSNIARAGMFVHVNGDMVDLGVIDHFQFQLVPLLPIRVKPGMAIGQVTFWSVTAS
jgi:dCTP deaminase